MKKGANLRGYMRRVMAEAHAHPPIVEPARFLSTDPWFIRSVCPGSDVTAISVAFIVPLVLQAALTVGIRVNAQLGPINDSDLEGLTGLPRIGEAWVHTRIAARDVHGFYELSGVLDTVPHVRFDVKADNKEYHRRVVRAAKILGYRYSSNEAGRMTAFKRWVNAQDSRTTRLFHSLMRGGDIHGTTEDGETRAERRRRKEAEKAAQRQGEGATPAPGNREQTEPASPQCGPGLLRQDAEADCTRQIGEAGRDQPIVDHGRGGG